MRHLALVISRNLGRLSQLCGAAERAGFSVNCSANLIVASALISRYSSDYHVIILDRAVTGKRTSTFVKGVRGNAPKSRVMIVTDDPKFRYDDPLVRICDFEQALAVMPRLKRDVLRYRSNPLRKRSTA